MAGMFDGINFSGVSATVLPVLIVGLLLLVALGLAALFQYKRSFNVDVLRMEERANKNFQCTMFKAKKVQADDGVVKYKVLQGNIFSKPILIKPEESRDENGNVNGSTVYDMGNHDMIAVFKNINGVYSHIRFNVDRKCFENIPAEVEFWRSLAIRESNLAHQTGIDWKVIGIYILFTFCMIMNLVMFIYTLDHATKIAQGGVAVPGNAQQVPVGVQ